MTHSYVTILKLIMNTQPSSPMSTPNNDKMSPTERRASVSLAMIFALRMLGLFLILPVFSVYAKTLSGGESVALVGLAMGIYGLTQCFGQIPFGMASDKFGRKPVIIVGLILFAVGSFIAAGATSVHWTIVGRAIQGAGAISAAVTAFIADSTRDEHRTKAMAMVGISIGITFAVSLVAAPVLYRLIGMHGIFAMTGILSIIAIGVVLFVVPNVPVIKTKRVPFGEVLKMTELLRLNAGVFILHMTQMTMFVVLPSALVQYTGLAVSEHWKFYLPISLLAFVFMVPAVIIAEKYRKMKSVFVLAIALLLAVQLGYSWTLGHVMHYGWFLLLWLFVFFWAFNILEACLPSLVSKIAPPEAKGTALGVYNTCQSLGLFCGGLLGGWLQQTTSSAFVFLITAACVLLWLIIASFMKNLSYRDKAATSVQH